MAEEVSDSWLAFCRVWLLSADVWRRWTSWSQRIASGTSSFSTTKKRRHSMEPVRITPKLPSLQSNWWKMRKRMPLKSNRMTQSISSWWTSRWGQSTFYPSMLSKRGIREIRKFSSNWSGGCLRAYQLQVQTSIQSSLKELSQFLR